MAISSASKSLLGLLGVGAAGGTVLGGYKIFKSDKETPKVKKIISQLIRETGERVLLTKADSSESPFWKAAWKAYREANKNFKTSEDPWSINGFKGNYDSSIPDEKAPDSFIDKCVSLSNNEVEGMSDTQYTQVSDWCTRNYKVSASSFLYSDNKVLLTNTTANSDEAWKASWETYRKEYASSNKNPWNIQDWNNKKDKTGENAPQDFISKCATEASVLVPNKEALEYQNILKYCTKAK
ncbi:hypothetical protein MHC_04890 [Mycoplasma haemocanis str. Illinois]|uniref:Uncharacterized protein n=1 Tax=Mycoplasma haemocanis (strain Illinois) TaxID=1111676 RepID=H6N862_MYCHN|nr:hypothetical protein [Mycoplasma haemocanis]AEW45834.1 hypothetical protein MHC_04890 [Mycoplasma haemocanis str. Illinois]